MVYVSHKRYTLYRRSWQQVGITPLLPSRSAVPSSRSSFGPQCRGHSATAWAACRPLAQLKMPSEECNLLYCNAHHDPHSCATSMLLPSLSTACSGSEQHAMT